MSANKSLAADAVAFCAKHRQNCSDLSSSQAVRPVQKDSLQYSRFTAGAFCLTRFGATLQPSGAWAKPSLHRTHG